MIMSNDEDDDDRIKSTFMIKLKDDNCEENYGDIELQPTLAALQACAFSRSSNALPHHS